jgi:putative salt-induced outer membrane protein YdiY
VTHTSRPVQALVAGSFALLLLSATRAVAQAPAAAPAATPPPPLWDTQIGASFVGTSGNSDTSSLGADLAANWRGNPWGLASRATAVRATSRGIQTAERYLGSVRAQRTLTRILTFSTGERAERDRLSGIGFRNVLDAGVAWALVRAPRWTLDGTTSLAWNHESRLLGSNVDDPVGVLELVSRIPFGTAGDTTQRFTFYPDFTMSSAYRSEAEVTAQASMNAHLALKLGYLLRYSNDPVPGFEKTDNTATASIVLQWRSAETVSR